MANQDAYMSIKPFGQKCFNKTHPLHTPEVRAFCISKYFVTTVEFGYLAILTWVERDMAGRLQRSRNQHVITSSEIKRTARIGSDFKSFFCKRKCFEKAFTELLGVSPCIGLCRPSSALVSYKSFK